MLHTPCQEEAQLLVDTGFGYTLSLIGGISYKTLAATLKELERDGLISRTEYPQIPPKVEYALTARGRSLLPVLDAMCAWGRAHREAPR